MNLFCDFHRFFDLFSIASNDYSHTAFCPTDTPGADLKGGNIGKDSECFDLGNDLACNQEHGWNAVQALLWLPHFKGHVDDIAGCALYLASPAACWVTGKVIEVDGGSDVSPLDIPLPPL